MLKIDLQFFGGRGTDSTSGGASGGLDGNDILSTRSLVSERERNADMVDQTLGVFKDAYSDYGTQINDIQIAKLKPNASAIAYYDSSDNIAINERYFNKATMESAYAKCVESGFHPSNGKRTATEAVVAHEVGHKLTADVAAKMGKQGFMGLDVAAVSITRKAMRKTGHKNWKTFAQAISGYSTHSHAETVAEAFSDVYCNGKGAKRESLAVVAVIDSYLK